MNTKVNSFKNVNWPVAVLLTVVAILGVARLPMASHKVSLLDISADTTMIKVQAPAVPAAKTQTRPLAQTLVQPTVMPPAQTLPVLPILPPTVTLKVQPQYPANVLQAGTTGAVLLSVLVGLNGLPENIAVKTSSGVAELDQAAIIALNQWRFSPASQGGAALASWYDIPVKFAIN